jgi:small redox-active disulfide protein 2
MSESADAQAQVRVLGPGCRRCDTLYERLGRVLEEMNREDVSVEHVKDPDEILTYGPILTPALVIDGLLVLSGRVPTESALRELLGKHLG